MWQQMNTAPKDGTTVLTDMGFVRYLRQEDCGIPVEEGWHLCDMNDWFIDVTHIEPVEPMFWMPLTSLSNR